MANNCYIDADSQHIGNRENTECHWGPDPLLDWRYLWSKPSNLLITHYRQADRLRQWSPSLNSDLWPHLQSVATLNPLRSVSTLTAEEERFDQLITAQTAHLLANSFNLWKAWNESTQWSEPVMSVTAGPAKSHGLRVQWRVRSSQVIRVTSQETGSRPSAQRLNSR